MPAVLNTLADIFLGAPLWEVKPMGLEWAVVRVRDVSGEITLHSIHPTEEKAILRAFKANVE